MCLSALNALNKSQQLRSIYTSMFTPSIELDVLSTSFEVMTDTAYTGSVQALHAHLSHSLFRGTVYILQATLKHNKVPEYKQEDLYRLRAMDAYEHNNGVMDK